MLIFDNTSNSESFSVVLRDKTITQNGSLFLKLTKLDNLEDTSFSLTNTSTSADYYSFVIDPSTLDQGEYVAQILQGSGVTGDCVVNTPETVAVTTTFDCDPLIINDEFIVEALALFIDGEVGSSSIYVTKCRVEGPTYNTVYSNQAEPTYYVYNE